MKRAIISKKQILAEGETSADDRFNDAIDELEADFDYLMESIDKMVREGNMASAMELVTNVKNTINDSIGNATDQIGTGDVTE